MVCIPPTLTAEESAFIYLFQEDLPHTELWVYKERWLPAFQQGRADYHTLRQYDDMAETAAEQLPSVQEILARVRTAELAGEVGPDADWAAGYTSGYIYAEEEDPADTTPATPPAPVPAPPPLSPPSAANDYLNETPLGQQLLDGYEANY